MDNTGTTPDWPSLFLTTYDDFAAVLLALLPKLLVAAAIMLMGLLVAHLLRFLSRRLIASTMQVVRRSGLILEDQQSLLQQPEVVISRIVFWFVLIFFGVAAAKTFGFDLFSQWLSSLLSYLPVLITAALILLIGTLLSSMAKIVVSRASIATNIGHHVFLGRLAQFVIIATTVVIAIEHLGVDVSFFTTAMIVLLGVVAFGFSLAFGLGAKDLIGNITGAQACFHHLQEGDEVSIAEFQGRVIEIGQSYLIIESPSGRHIIPARVFLESPVTIITPDVDS